MNVEGSIFLALAIYLPIRVVVGVDQNLNGIHKDFWAFMPWTKTWARDTKTMGEIETVNQDNTSETSDRQSAGGQDIVAPLSHLHRAGHMLMSTTGFVLVGFFCCLFCLFCLLF